MNKIFFYKLFFKKLIKSIIYLFLRKEKIKYKKISVFLNIDVMNFLVILIEDMQNIQEEIDKIKIDIESY